MKTDAKEPEPPAALTPAASRNAGKIGAATPDNAFCVN
jgi:hypothetical protein